MILNLIHFEAVFPILALFVNAMIGKKRSHLAARLASYFMGSGFVAGLILLTGVHFSRTAVNFAENLNTVPLLLCTLIFLLVSLFTVTLFTTWMGIGSTVVIFSIYQQLH